jgi:hypothetical protein
VLAISIIAWVPRPALADQGGISFWLPGLFGSLAAVPGVPGPSFAALYVHTSVAAGGNKSFPLNGQIVAGLKGGGNLAAFGPTYTFETPVFGGQAALSLLGIGGRTDASISATLTGPRGNTLSGTRTDSRAGFGDLFPQVSLKWNAGVHNWMGYLTGNIPVGAYDADRLANLGLGHGAIDGGGGYTFLDPQTGHELSAVVGLTHNFTNQAIDYQNGLDFHLDWGASQFLSKEVFVGLVGYFFNQITGDSGAGAQLGGFESRVAGIGPQLGCFVPIGSAHGFFGLKGYKEFGSQNRPPGWNFWLTFAISPAPPASPAVGPQAMASK